MAYVFSRSGNLLAKQRLEQDRAQPDVGRATLAVEATGTVVIKVGPEVDDIGALDRQNPAVKSYEMQPNQQSTIAVELLKAGVGMLDQEAVPGNRHGAEAGSRRQRSHHVNVVDRQQFLTASGEPLVTRVGLALGAVPGAAGVERDGLMAALTAAV